MLERDAQPIDDVGGSERSIASGRTVSTVADSMAELCANEWFRCSGIRHLGIISEADVTPAMRAKRILIVEDDDDLRRLFRMTLTVAGYDVEEAGDGVEALQRIDNHPPDLVVLDLMLRALDGISVQQELAARAFTAHIPIVVVTGSGVDVTGVNVACVLRKPVLPDELITTVAACLAAPGARA